MNGKATTTHNGEVIHVKKPSVKEFHESFSVHADAKIKDGIV